MKKITFLLLLLIGIYNNAFTQGCPTSIVSFTSQFAVDNFPILYPDCTEPEGIFLHQNSNPSSSIKNLDGFSQITRIGDVLKIEEMDSLTNLSGLENLTFARSISINDNEILSDISALNSLDSVEHLWIRNNPLVADLSHFATIKKIKHSLSIYELDSITTLHGFENVETIGNIAISNNEALTDITALSNLTKSSRLIVFDNDALLSLEGLQNIDTVSGSVLISSNDNLIDLNQLSSLSFVGEHFSISWNLSLENFSGLENLKYIGGNFSVGNNENLENFSGLQMLESINGEMLIYNNDKLNHLGAIEDVDLSNVTKLSYHGNELLALCSERNICNYLANGGVVQNLISNAPGCNSISEVLDACNFDFGKIYTEVFFDENQNKIKDAGEVSLPGVGFDILPIESTIFSNDLNGITTYLENGNYVMDDDPSSHENWALTTDSTSFHFSIDDPLDCDTISFGFFPSEQISNNISSITGPPARCGEFKNFQAHTKNLGTTITDGTLWLEVDPIIAAIGFIDIPDTTVAPNLYGWHFENLYPGYSFDAAISLKVPAPPDVMIGDSLRFHAHVAYEDINGAATSDNFYYPTEIRCSFDPNDKLVNPSRNNNLTLFEEDLIYTIRFQNTGNDEAYDIIIRDTLDENLDPTTFKILSTSHPNVLITSMEADQYLTFNFENIYLPDSTTNFDASQGYVSYLIAPKEGLAEETLIENTASIYFDFNPPIVTNTTENVMVSELPTNVHNLGGAEGMKIEIFPNPVTNHIFIKKEKSKTLEYQITDVNGRLLINGKLTNEIHNITFTKMNSGVYFIKIINTANREYIVEKIVK